MKCYEIKNCCFNGTEHVTSKCPPHKFKIGCWEYNWVSFYNKMPECKEKLEWREIMLNKCPKCEVYEIHKDDMEKILQGLRNA